MRPVPGEQWVHWNTGDICTVLAVSYLYDDDHRSIEVVVTQSPHTPKYAKPNAVAIWRTTLFVQSFRAMATVNEKWEVVQ